MPVALVIVGHSWSCVEYAARLNPKGEPVKPRHLYHGTDGDTILKIMTFRQILPNASGEVYFSENRPESVFMHGPDRVRKVSFAVKLEVSIPPGAKEIRKPTAGVVDTLVVITQHPLPARVLELYIRKLEDGGGVVEKIVGDLAVRKHLQG